MIRFHFVNNAELDREIMSLCERFNCRRMSDFVNRFLFRNLREYLIFVNRFCQEGNFAIVSGCRVNRKVSIPESVYHGLKLCHKELDTYSIALIWRSLLLKVVECFNDGGLEVWEEYKRQVIERGEMKEKRLKRANKSFLASVISVHIPGVLSNQINKIGFYDNNNEFLWYLRC